MEVARQLAGYDFEGVEVWAALMPAFILEDHQRYREAMEIVRNAVTRFGSRLSEDDAKWTASYIDFLLQVEAGRAPPRRPSWPGQSPPSSGPQSGSQTDPQFGQQSSK